MKILIVEDDHNSRILLERRLSKEGYTLYAAVNGLEALNMAKENLPDMVISDIMMPEMDGFELCREMKADRQLCKVPFLFYTATYLDSKDEQLAMALGGEKFIAKPIEIDRFLSIIKDVFNKYKHEKPKTSGIPTKSDEDLTVMYSETIRRKLDEKMQELQTSEEKYRNLFEFSRDGIFIFSMDWKILDANKQFFRLTGFNRDQIINRDVNEICPEAQTPKSVERIQNMLDGKEVDLFETILSCNYGKQKPVEIGATKLENCYGEAVVFQANIRDITERKNAEEEKLQTEKKLKAIFNHRFQLTGLLDASGKLVMANENVYKMAGNDSSELIGKYLWDLPHWSHSSKLRQKIREAVNTAQTGTALRFETTHPDAKGDIHVIDFSLTPVQNENGEVIFIVPEGHDVTERKRAENKLIESEQNYREIYNSSSDAIFIHDAETGKIVDVNQTMLEMFGYSYEDALQLDISKISTGEPPYSQKDALNKISKAVTEGPQLFDWLACHKDGSQFWIEVALRNTTIGGKGRVLAVVRDITERKKLDAELRLIKHSIENITNPFLWIQNDSRFFYVNNAACDLLGYSIEEFCSMHVGDIDPDYSIKIWQKFWEKLKTEKSLTFESSHLTKNNQTIPVEILANYLEFEGEEHVFAYVKDIREKIKYQNEQKELEKHLLQAQKMEALGTLAGGIAHDFNNILSPILGYTQMVHDVIPEDSSEKQMLKEVLKASYRASELVKQILTFSRQSKQELNPLNIPLVVKEALKLTKASLPSTIEIKESILKDCGVVLADPTQIHQITMNLITNAYHAMEETGGTLTIELKNVEMSVEDLKDPKMEPGEYVCLSVSDTGKGIDPKNLDSIFNPYFTTKEPGKGTGLGLSIVNSIIKSYKGDLRVYSELGQGTVFRVFLPLIQLDTSKNDESLKVDVLKGKERLLIVDDDATILMMQEEMLSRLGYDVTTRNSSLDALELFKEDPSIFDLIITDLTMPKMTGDRLAQNALTIRPDIPILICTGFSDVISEDRIKEIGISGVVMKPIILKEIAKAIRTSIGDLVD